MIVEIFEKNNSEYRYGSLFKMNTYNHYDICSEESASFSPMTTDQDASDSSYSQSFEY